MGSFKHVLVVLAYFIVDGLSYQPTSNNAGFDPTSAAALVALKNAVYSQDMPTVTNILSHRLYDQRLGIARSFMQTYGKPLKDELIDHASPEMKDLLVALVVPTHIFYATELHNAMKGAGTNEKVLIQILCTLTNSEMRDVINAYEPEFHHKLVDDVKGDTSGDFKKLLVALLHADRDESGVVNKAQAATDALHLHKAGLDRVGTDEKVFFDILGTRNYNQLRLICEEYKRLTDHELEYAIKKEFSGNAKDALLTIISVAKNRPAYFAERLNHCMTANHHKNEQLIRIVVPRVRIDMDYIKQEYSNAYHKDLKSDISEHTEGLFKDALLNLIH